jgi:phytoene dehydrogenase-like protein
MPDYDAIVVGAGPNGLSAAIVLAQAGCSVQMVEACETIGGGTRTQELTLPGFQHDVCSAIHPLGVASPFLSQLPLADYGLEWIFPEASAAHPLDGGDAVMVYQDVERTAAELGADQFLYKRMMGGFSKRYDHVLGDYLAPLGIPHHPIAYSLFGLMALMPASLFAKGIFREERTRAMFAGMAAHSIQPLDRPATAAFGLMLLLLAHAVGWPMAKGGSQQITLAMGKYLESLGGDIATNCPVTTLDDLPSARKILFDVTPRQLVAIAGESLPESYRKRLGKYRYGPGVFKIDYALSEPTPWSNPHIRGAGTVHLGNTLPEIALSERQCTNGIHAEKPYVLYVQQSQLDATRAPTGKHTAWAYCHVPHGSTQDMTAAIEGQIERYAPGFRDCILQRHTITAMGMETYNPNYIGGDINGGVLDLRQLFTRPVMRWSPYTTPNPDLLICSSSTPPGGGVHGMCGYHAAQAALKSLI